METLGQWYSRETRREWCYWSKIPLELADEISGHNKHNIPTLCAMALTSKAVRSSAIPHLFSDIYLSCDEDVHTWLEVLSRTPELGTRIVKMVTVCVDEWNMQESKPISDNHAVDMSKVPPIPSARVVRYDACVDVTPASFLSLFPNLTKLQLLGAFVNFSSMCSFLGACGGLRVLSLGHVKIGGSQLEHSMYRSCRHTLVDLTMLQELEINAITPHDYFIHLLDHSPPLALKSLGIRISCHIDLLEKVLKLVARSIEKLAVFSGTHTTTDDAPPAFIFCPSVSSHMDPSADVVRVFVMGDTRTVFKADLEYLDGLLYVHPVLMDGRPLWKNSAGILKKWPSFQQFVLQLCYNDDCYIRRHRNVKIQIGNDILERMSSLLPSTLVQWYNWERDELEISEEDNEDGDEDIL
ncbi:hypothetical protein C8J57DRAFT_1721918 [Mycena rebaudengoi]|nr:hypothetical protein C8J57DRAFT_1721918 [Mycena rebaudengoi]